MDVDFDSTEESNDYVSVPAGTYACRVAEVRQRSTRAGEPLWSVKLVVSEGEHTGRHAAWDNLVFSLRGRARVRRVFEALGLPCSGKVNVEPADLEGKEALVEVRAAEYTKAQGGVVKRNEVPYDGYRPLLKDAAVGRTEPGGGKSAAAPADDDDQIPF